VNDFLPPIRVGEPLASCRLLSVVGGGAFAAAAFAALLWEHPMIIVCGGKKVVVEISPQVNNRGSQHDFIFYIVW
jgi:hypothetical protein